MKRRFPILLKVILLGIGVSILTSGTAVTVSYFNQVNRGEQNLIDSIDNTLEAANDVFSDLDGQNTLLYVEYLNDIRNYVQNIYINDTDKKTIDDFNTFDEFAAYYQTKYRWIYPHDPRFGLLEPGEAEFKLAYYTILNLLDNFQISSGSVSAFLSYEDVDKTLVFLADSRMDNSDRKANDYFHVPGYYYHIKSSDYFVDSSHNKHMGCRLDGYLTRFIEIREPASTPDEPQRLIANLYIQYDLSKVHKQSLDVLYKELLIIGLSALALIAIYTAFSYLLFVKNINKLSKSSSEIRQRLVDKNMNEIVDIPIKSNDEMSVLKDSLIEMEKAIINYVDIIHKEAQEKERNNAELMVASKIQLDSLPPEKLEDKNASLRAFIKTAKEVGGDFYDYFYLDDHRLAVLISDVSGKGIPASLFMMKGKELIKSAVQSYKSLVEAVNGVNNMLVKNNEELLFITSFVAIIDFEKGEIKYVNAGHEKPYIVSKDKVIKLDGESNIMLGVEANYQFKQESHKFNEGDYLFLFTDGLNESINDSEEEFGYQRIEESLKDTGDSHLDDVINKLINNLDSFTGCREQFDDITMLAVKCKKNELHLRYEQKDYSIISDATDKFNEYFSFIADDKKASIGIIIDEIVNNYVSYEEREDLVIEVNFKLVDNDLEIVFSCNGNDYDPFKNHKEKFLETFHSEIELGGFGLSIVKDLSKSHKYHYKDGHSYIEIVVAL